MLLVLLGVAGVANVANIAGVAGVQIAAAEHKPWLVICQQLELPISNKNGGDKCGDSGRVQAISAESLSRSVSGWRVRLS